MQQWKKSSQTVKNSAVRLMRTEVTQVQGKFRIQRRTQAPRAESPLVHCSAPGRSRTTQTLHFVEEPKKTNRDAKMHAKMKK